MELSEVIKTRHSVRSFSNKPVEKNKLMKVLESARLAPSWVNKQCWHFIIVKNKMIIQELIQAVSIINKWMKTAPIIIVGCANPKDSDTRQDISYYLVDFAIAMEHLILSATDLGLGTCWIGGFNETKIKKILHIPNSIRVIALTPLGYPAKKPRLGEKIAKSITQSSQRKSLQEIVSIDNW